MAGGRIFPGVHHRASFDVQEAAERYEVSLESDDGHTWLHVTGSLTDEIPASSVFDSVEAASSFFEGGSLGYSATAVPGEYEGLELRCLVWHVEPLAVEAVGSSFFDGRKRFPDGTTAFDCALLMRGIDHEWHSRPPLCVGEHGPGIA